MADSSKKPDAEIPKKQAKPRPNSSVISGCFACINYIIIISKAAALARLATEDPRTFDDIFRKVM